MSILKISYNKIVPESVPRQYAIGRGVVFRENAFMQNTR